jgi:endoglucanase Acf2
MKNLTNPKLNLKKKLVANLSDSQMRGIMGGNLQNHNEFKNQFNGQITIDPILETTSMQSYFCK